MMQKLVLLFLLPFTLITAFSQNKLKYSGYENSRFLYSFSYPSTLVTQQPESENGDGAKFTNKEGKERIRCWGRWNQDVEGNTINLEQRYQLDIKSLKEEKATITYKKITVSYYVISGKEQNGTIFYQKAIPKKEEGAFAYLLIRYPVSESKTWDEPIKKITGSLK
jgi:hypothetical protein